MDGNYAAGSFPHVDVHGNLPSFECWSDYLLHEDVPVLERSIISPPVIAAAGGSPEWIPFTVENISMEEQNSAQSRQAANIKYNSTFLQLTIVRVPVLLVLEKVNFPSF